MPARRPTLVTSLIGLLGAIGLILVAAACGSSSTNGSGTGDTLAIGELPPTVASPASNDGGSGGSTASLAPGSQAGARVRGNKVILIGDSVMASTASRYGGEMCKALVPLGWQAEVDAESGQFVPWGQDVLDARLAAKWDAAVILLGNNYLGEQDKYRFEIERMINRLSPSIVVLLRVTEFIPNRRQVNAVIDELAKTHSNVITLDWAAVTGADGSLTGPDGLHLTNQGRARLAAEVAKTLGAAPTSPGECLKSKFTDDSRGPVTGTTVAGTGTGTGTTVNGGHTSSSVSDTTSSSSTAETSTTESPITASSGG